MLQKLFGTGFIGAEAIPLVASGTIRLASALSLGA